jgi:hypothetical protein
LQRLKEPTNSPYSELQTIKRWKANWIGKITSWNCLRKHVNEGKMEESINGFVGRRRKQLLDYFKEIRGY